MRNTQQWELFFVFADRQPFPQHRSVCTCTVQSQSVCCAAQDEGLRRVCEAVHRQHGVASQRRTAQRQRQVRSTSTVYSMAGQRNTRRSRATAIVLPMRHAPTSCLPVRCGVLMLKGGAASAAGAEPIGVRRTTPPEVAKSEWLLLSRTFGCLCLCVARSTLVSFGATCRTSCGEKDGKIFAFFVLLRLALYHQG
jgi:hypothetical protein